MIGGNKPSYHNHVLLNRVLSMSDCGDGSVASQGYCKASKNTVKQTVS
jgi:hypothetical protein